MRASEVAPDVMAVKHKFEDRDIHTKYMECDGNATITSRLFCEEAAAMIPPKKGPTRKMVGQAVHRHVNGLTLAIEQQVEHAAETMMWHVTQ